MLSMKVLLLLNLILEDDSSELPQTNKTIGITSKTPNLHSIHQRFKSVPKSVNLTLNSPTKTDIGQECPTSELDISTKSALVSDKKYKNFG